jgi:nuclear pore complex protein Nup62
MSLSSFMGQLSSSATEAIRRSLSSWSMAYSSSMCSVVWLPFPHGQSGAWIILNLWRCMYACMYACMYVCTMYVRMYVCTYECMYLCIYVCMYMCVRIYVCMYLCSCFMLCLYICVHIVCKRVCMHTCLYAVFLHTRVLKLSMQTTLRAGRRSRWRGGRDKTLRKEMTPYRWVRWTRIRWSGNLKARVALSAPNFDFEIFH